MGSKDGVGSVGAASPDARLAAIAARAAGQMGAENFPVALRILPREPRTLLTRFYDYARFVDDVGDTADGDRLELLDVVAADVRTLWSGGPARLPVVAALAPLRDRCQAPSTPFLDLIEANRVDQRVAAYETFADLLGYCELSAAPVGRVVLHIFGAATPATIADSDRVCAALQVFEHCQDVGEDARAGRVYLPATDLRAAGVPGSELVADSTSPALRTVIGQQVARSRVLLADARPLVRGLSGWARLAVAGFAGGGYATADALDRSGYRVLESAVRPSRVRTARHALALASGR